VQIRRAHPNLNLSRGSRDLHATSFAGLGAVRRNQTLLSDSAQSDRINVLVMFYQIFAADAISLPPNWEKWTPFDLLALTRF